LGFGLGEAAAAWLADSLALMSDAGHMVSDALALGIAAHAERVAHKQGSGAELHRAEIRAAFINAIFMVIILAWIVYEAIVRLQAPRPVDGRIVMLTAAIGIVVNAIVARVISHGAQTLNTRAAMLHVLGDLAGSVVALIAGVVIYFTGWLPVDPLLSLVVAGLIGFATLKLRREASAATRAERQR